MGMLRGTAYSSQARRKQEPFRELRRDYPSQKNGRAEALSRSLGRGSRRVQATSSRRVKTALSKYDELTLIEKLQDRQLSKLSLRGTDFRDLRKKHYAERRHYPKEAKGKSIRSAPVTGVEQGVVNAVANSVHLIFVAVMVLVMLGLLSVFSAGASLEGNADLGYSSFLTQLLWISVGWGCAWILSKLKYQTIAKFSFLGVVASLALLIAVFPFGVQSFGSKRSLHIYGPLYFQPSEFAKISMILFCAYALHVKREKIKQFSHLCFPLLLFLALTCGLIVIQRDLGSASIIFLSILVVMALSEARMFHVGIVGILGAVGCALATYDEPYRLLRFLAFFNPWKDPLGYGYQLIQSYIAFGTGGLFGLGPGMSRQKFLYLPNAHNDFVFSIIGEEFGLVGTLVVIFMFIIIAIAGMKIAEHAPDQLGRILAAGITSLFVIQALVNMGGVTGLMPITGVTLPFVSAGGSSMLVCMGCLGILFNVARQVESTGGKV